ncbi:hypothetical protein [Meiothermus sp.]|uniref:hypothetical protein n=1 Tax=Meiothermus sp. TaxID=1955249 RepID=UPI0025E1DF54|nr:hypothetical protein [Meiothermus sp.]
MGMATRRPFDERILRPPELWVSPDRVVGVYVDFLGWAEVWLDLSASDALPGSALLASGKGRALLPFRGRRYAKGAALRASKPSYGSGRPSAPGCSGPCWSGPRSRRTAWPTG